MGGDCGRSGGDEGGGRGVGDRGGRGEEGGREKRNNRIPKGFCANRFMVMDLVYFHLQVLLSHNGPGVVGFVFDPFC